MVHPPMPPAVVAPHTDIKARRPRRWCLRETCRTECTLCAQARTPAHSPHRTIQSLCTPCSTPAAETSTESTTPTQACDVTVRQPLCSSTMYNRPSSPKFLNPHSYTRIASIESPASTTYSTQIRPAQCRSRPISTIARLLYTRVPPCPRKSSSP